MLHILQVHWFFANELNIKYKSCRVIGIEGAISVQILEIVPNKRVLLESDIITACCCLLSSVLDMDQNMHRQVFWYILGPVH